MPPLENVADLPMDMKACASRVRSQTPSPSLPPSRPPSVPRTPSSSVAFSTAPYHVNTASFTLVKVYSLPATSSLPKISAVPLGEEEGGGQERAQGEKVKRGKEGEEKGTRGRGIGRRGTFPTRK